MVTPAMAARLATLQEHDRHAQAAQAHHIRCALAATAGRHAPAPAARRLPTAGRAIQTALRSVRSGTWWARPSIS